MIRVEGGPNEDQVHFKGLAGRDSDGCRRHIASGSSALAQSNNGPCSNATLSGDYGFTIAGDLILGPSEEWPMLGKAASLGKA